MIFDSCFSLGSNKKLNLSYDIDLQNLLIQKTEEILQTNLQQYQNVNYLINSCLKNFFTINLEFNNIEF